jgi:alanine-glyoxylate transaminase / serine-glyoxylate transaminase / serine-pyruvate transaminase
LTTVRVPEGIDELYVRKKLLSKHNIEVGGGLGDLKGKIWRVGLMGENSHANSVFLLLAALSGILESAGFACSTKEALDEAGKAYGK